MAGLYDADVIVVGAGLTGLQAAFEVSRAGLAVLVFERSAHVGGRMSTEVVEGFKLDRGFQVLLTGYPEVRRLKGLERLYCRSFSSGARIRCDGGFVDFFDPLHHPDKLFSTISSRLATIKDLLLTFMMTRGSSSSCTPLAQTTDVGLREAGFSRRFQEYFLRPFLRGVLLDPLLRADYGLARFYLKMFAIGEAALPSEGIQGLPNMLAEQIGRSHIRLGSSVNSISATEVTLENGDSYTARHVVCAVDTMAATQLGSPEQTLTHVSSCTLYFSAARPPFEDRLVVASAEEGPISTLAVVSNVQPSYAPPDKALIAITVLGDAAGRGESDLVSGVMKQAASWYGEQVSEWRLLSCIRLPAAVVTRPRMASGFIERDGIFFAGDYLSYPSQNGALQAGRKVGEAIVERLA
jgi:Flavin containing amine oxidoreductase